MGTVYKISCQCGYNKKLSLGCGLSAFNLKSVNRIFSKEKLKEFNRNLESKSVKRFWMENIAAFCANCNEIVQVVKLNVELENGNKFSVINDCPVCNHTIEVLNKDYKCPICKNKVNIIEIGLWD